MEELELLKQQIQATQMLVNKLDEEIQKLKAVATPVAQWFVFTKQFMDGFSVQQKPSVVAPPPATPEAIQ